MMKRDDKSLMKIKIVIGIKLFCTIFTIWIC